MDPQHEPAGDNKKAEQQHDAAKGAEKAAGNIAQRRLPANALPIRQYLESTVVPILMQGLQSLCRERPDDPVEYMANYLLQHNPKKNDAAAAGRGAGAKADAADKPKA